MAFEDIFQHFSDSENQPAPLSAGQFGIPGDPSLANLSPMAISQGASLVPGEQGGIPDLQKDNGESILKATPQAPKSGLISNLNSQLGKTLDSSMEFDPDVISGTKPSDQGMKTEANPLTAAQSTLDAALKDRQNNMNDSVLRGAGTDAINAALIGMGNKHQFTPGYGDERLNQMNDLKLKDFKEGMALPGEVKTSEEAKSYLGDLTDKTSPQAELYRNIIGKLYHQDPSKLQDLSIEQMQKSLDTLAPAVDKQMQIEMMGKHYDNEHLDALAKMREQENIAGMRRDALKEKAEQKASDTQNKAYSHTMDQLEQIRGNPAVKQAESNILSAKNINSIISEYPDPNKIPVPMLNFLNKEVARMAMNGVPAQSDLAGMDSETYRKKLAEFEQKVTNQGAAANGGDFVKIYKKYVDDIQNNSQDVIKDRYGRVINPKKSLLNEDQFKTLNDQYINRFKTEAAPKFKINGVEIPSSFSQDVMDYASQHNITPQQAQAIKDQRTK